MLTGFAGAFAVATSLYKHRKTGEADVARASLAAAGQLLQTPFMYDYESREPFNEISGRHIKGSGPLYRCYKALDRRKRHKGNTRRAGVFRSGNY